MVQIFQKKHKLGIGQPVAEEDSTRGVFHQEHGPESYRKVWESAEEGHSPYEVLGRVNSFDLPDFAGVLPVGRGDLLAIDGAEYLVCEEHVEQVIFDHAGIKSMPALHYGESVDYSNAVMLPSGLVNIAQDLGIPYGYVVGIDDNNGNPVSIGFEREPDDNYEIAYLHPEFYAGKQAAIYIDKLQELSESQHFLDVRQQLTEVAPIRIFDLDKAIVECHRLDRQGAEHERQSMTALLSELGTDEEIGSTAMPDGSTQQPDAMVLE